MNRPFPSPVVAAHTEVDEAEVSRNDLDLLVEFQSIEPAALVGAYFGLEQQLSSITGQTVDLMMADAARNPYVLRDIDASKQLIYEAVR